MPKTSDIISAIALIVAIGSGFYAKRAYDLAYMQDQRALAAKKPMIDILPQAVDARHWKLAITVNNRSDERIVASGIAIPSPEGGFLTVSQTEPIGPTASGAQLNSVQGFQMLNGRPISAGAVGIWSGSYEIADAFPAKPKTSLTLQMRITYLGANEHTEVVSTMRQLN